MLEAMSRKSRKPVVGVHEIRSTASTDMPRNAIGELIHDTEEFVLRQVRRTSIDVHHAMVGFDFDDLRERVAPPSSVRRALHALARKSRHEFADIDVHPATVTDARLGKWRGVHRQHGDALHHL